MSASRDRWEPGPTRRGYDVREVVSALQKAVRRSDPDAALYWAAELCKSGYPDWAWKRLLVIAVEDVGPVPGLIADVQALHQAYVDSKRSEGRRFDPAGGLFFMAQALILLCRAPKDRIVDWAFMHHLSDHAERREIPDEARDVHTREGRRLGRGWQHFLEESGQIIDPDEAARSRGYADMADELEQLSGAYREAFEMQHTGRSGELPANPWSPGGKQEARSAQVPVPLFEDEP